MDKQPQWQPISMLPVFTDMIDGMLEASQEQLANLQLVREKPHVMDDATLQRMVGLYSNQLEDQWLFEEQFSRWLRENLKPDETREVERLMALHQRVVLRPDRSDKEGSSPVDRLRAAREVEPPRCAQKDDVHDIVDHLVCELGEKQRAVVERRFGLHGYRRATLEQIGDEIGVTRERVRQIQLAALKNLREMMESHGISGDLLLD